MTSPLLFRRSSLAPLLVIASASVQAGCSTPSNGSGPAAGLDASIDHSVVVDGAIPDARPPLDASLDTGDARDAANEDADDSGIEGGPADANDDADAADADAAPLPCPGVLCQGACLADASDCTGCGAAPLLCGPTHTCVAGCSSCTDATDGGLPIECFACDSTHANPRGTCEPADASAYCLSGSYLGALPDGAAGFHCACGDGGASDCPGNTQVCAPTPGGAQICVTCGEVYIDDLTDASCKNGKSCSPAAAACQ